MSNKVSVIEQKEVARAVTPMDLIEIGVQQNVDVDKLQKLWELQQQYEAAEARKAFVSAMSEFKKNQPKVIKDKVNAQYNSRYAGISNLLETVAPVLAECGITHSYNQDTASNPISVTCILTHELGHSESTTMFGNRDDSGKKNDLQKIKSTNTYLRIATFESITGIVASDDGDDDGNSTGNLDLNEVITLFEGANTLAKLDSLATHAAKLPHADKTKAKEAYSKRKGEFSS